MPRTYDESAAAAMAGALMAKHRTTGGPNMTHLDTLIRAGRRLARDLTEIDAAVRVIQSRPDWLAAAKEELAVTQRSLELSLDRIREARTRYAALALGWQAGVGGSMLNDEAQFQELLAVVETTMGE